MAKKVGWFFMSIVPLVVSLVLQLGLGVVVAVVYGFIAVGRESAGGLSDTNALYTVFRSHVMEGVSMGIFVYHVVGTLVFMLWYYLAFVRKKGQKGSLKKLLPVRLLNGKALIVAVLAGVLLCILANAMVNSAQYIVPEVIARYEQIMEESGFGSGPLMFVAAVILAPVGEEFLCRGIIMHYAKKVSGRFWIANMIQALLFGIMHMNIVQGTYAFVIGLVLGWLYERYQTLVIPIIIHFVVNFSSSTWIFVIFYFLPQNLFTSMAILAASAAALVLVLYWAGKREENKDISSDYITYQ